MKLVHLGRSSGPKGCPELYLTDHDTYIVQGKKVTDPEALAALRARGLPDHETAVEIPAALLGYAPKDLTTPKLVGESWDEAFRTFERSAWRLEAQGVYHEPYERQPLIDFLAGGAPDLSFMDEWVRDVRADVAAGKTYGRVRVLAEPLTDYLRFELSFTQLNVDAGEEIRVLPMHQFEKLDIPPVDFWLFDDTRAAVMHLDDNGFKYADLVTDDTEITRFREIRDRTWQNAIPFSEYLSNR